MNELLTVLLLAAMLGLGNLAAGILLGVVALELIPEAHDHVGSPAESFDFLPESI